MIIIKWEVYCDGILENEKTCQEVLFLQGEFAHHLDKQLETKNWFSLFKQCETPKHYCVKCKQKIIKLITPEKKPKKEYTTKQRIKMKIEYRKRQLKLYEQANKEDQRRIERIENQGRVT